MEVLSRVPPLLLYVNLKLQEFNKHIKLSIVTIYLVEVFITAFRYFIEILFIVTLTWVLSVGESTLTVFLESLVSLFLST